MKPSIRWFCGQPTKSGWCHTRVDSGAHACGRHGRAGAAVLEWDRSCVLRRMPDFNLVCLVHESDDFAVARALGAEGYCDDLLASWREDRPADALTDTGLEGDLSEFARMAQSQIDQIAESLDPEHADFASVATHWSSFVRAEAAGLASRDQHGELLEQLARDPSAAVRAGVAGNPNASLDTLRDLLQDPDADVSGRAKSTLREVLGPVLETIEEKGRPVAPQIPAPQPTPWRVPPQPRPWVDPWRPGGPPPSRPWYERAGTDIKWQNSAQRAS